MASSGGFCQNSIKGLPHKTKFVHAIAQAWFRTIGRRDQDTFQHEMKYFHEVGSYYCPYDPDNESGADLDYLSIAEKLANEIKRIADDNMLSVELKSSGRQFSRWRERTIPDYFESELQSEKYVWELTIKA